MTKLENRIWCDVYAAVHAKTSSSSTADELKDENWNRTTTHWACVCANLAISELRRVGGVPVAQ